MTRLKSKIIRGIQSIDDEQLLLAVYHLLEGMQDEPKTISLNEPQKEKIKSGKEDISAGRVCSTSELFDQLENG